MNITYPVDALVSFHYYRRDDLMRAVTEPRHLRLIGDSGAFSAWSQGAPVQLSEYAAWCLKWRHTLCWVAALDVIGDPDATRRNWQIMRDDYGLDTVPTLHAGADPKNLDGYADAGVDYCGLGGLVGIAPRAFRWLISVFRYARDNHPGMRFHAWGVTNRQILEALPFYSADSSGIMGQAYRYARLRLFNPHTSRDTAIALDGRDPYRHRDLITGVYGIEPASILTSKPANRALLIKLAAASTQQYARWLQARHKVTAPTWGIREHASPDGTRVHLVGDGHPSTDPGKNALMGVQPGSGPRSHMTGDRQSPPNLSRFAEEGTRIHLVDGAAGPKGDHKLTDLATLSDDTGTRVHVVDANPERLTTLGRGSGTHLACH